LNKKVEAIHKLQNFMFSEQRINHKQVISSEINIFPVVFTNIIRKKYGAI